ncbi:MAG: sensor histidine kinase [Planctomycetales bacterium]
MTLVPFDYRVLTYVARLELALDRLRGQSSYLANQAAELIQGVQRLRGESGNADSAEWNRLGRMSDDLGGLLEDLQEPTRDAEIDRAVPIALRPFVESIFRWQQRLHGTSGLQLHLELNCQDFVWFPARLRHILEGLISQALKSQDSTKGECRIQMRLNWTGDAYELQVSDNGMGLSKHAEAKMFELFDRSGSGRLADPVVSLAVLKLLVEQSGGDISVVTETGQGASFLVRLPHFEVGDTLA